jgi:hypothetical protein
VTWTIRPAVEDDLESIAALTATGRRRLAGWSPVWWRQAAGADDLHPLWLRHLLDSEGPVMRVAVDDEVGTVVGCAASMPQPGQWVVDDMAVVDDTRWADVGVALFGSVEERPALTCIPTADVARADAARSAGLRRVSSYWIRTTEPTVPTESGPVGPDGLDIPAAPPHSFGGSLDARADGALVLVDDRGGLVVGSPSTPAPPVYDPGGTVCIVDRVTGHDRGRLLREASAAAEGRGDVLLTVVAAEEDGELQRLLDVAGFERTVDVHAWPEEA